MLVAAVRLVTVVLVVVVLVAAVRLVTVVLVVAVMEMVEATVVMVEGIVVMVALVGLKITVPEVQAQYVFHPPHHRHP